MSPPTSSSFPPLVLAPFLSHKRSLNSRKRRRHSRIAGLQLVQGRAGGDRREEQMRGSETQLTRREVLALTALGALGGAPGPAFAGSPEGQLTWGVHISLAPTW